MSCVWKPNTSVYQRCERSALRTKMLTWSRAAGLNGMSILLGEGRVTSSFPEYTSSGGRWLDLARQALHGAGHRRHAGPRQVEGHPFGAEVLHPADVGHHLGDGPLECRPARPLGLVGQVE